MKSLTTLTLAFALTTAAQAELRIPASTAYSDPWDRGVKISKDGISGWTDSAQKILWFGEIKTEGKLDASVIVRLPAGKSSKLRLTVAGQTHDAEAKGGAEPGTVRRTELPLANCTCTSAESSIPWSIPASGPRKISHPSCKVIKNACRTNTSGTRSRARSWPWMRTPGK